MQAAESGSSPSCLRKAVFCRCCILGRVFWTQNLRSIDSRYFRETSSNPECNSIHPNGQSIQKKTFSKLIA
ncbi:hypothetical protein TNCV_1724151 [Trichonephila clavipes]|nr:hypothetical protein TNCV_1724151 [Trichonephila clavipes]